MTKTISMKKLLFLKNSLLILLFTCSYSIISFAQDTEYWFVAPHNSEQVVAGYELNRPVFLAISNPNPSVATISISIGGTPIASNVAIAANGFYKKDFTSLTEARQIQNPRGLAGSVTKYGVHITSDIPVTAYYMVNHTDSRDIYTLKGSSALGTNFYAPMQSDNKCTTGSYTGACDQIDIVATEDNTAVTVTPKATIRIGTSGSSAANTPYTKTLNKGETLKIMEYTVNSGSLAGSSIVSNKPVAVTVTEDLVCGDTSGDQIVPVTSLGTCYVVAKGYMTTNADRVYLVGTAANTTVTINNGSGTNITKTLQAGDSYVYYFSTYASSNAIYIEASSPIYVYQRTGYNEEGAALLPSMYSISQNKVSYHQIKAHHEKGVLIFRTGTEAGFTITYGGLTYPLSSITTISPINIPGATEWKCARFDLPAAANDKVVTISSSKGIFSFGYIAANYPTNNSTSYGYLTAFGDFKFPEITYKCVGQPVTLTAGYAKSYRWWKGRATDINPTTIGTGNSYVVPADQEGYYSVEIDLDPRKLIVETYVKNDVLNLIANIPEYIQVNNNTSFSATVTRPEGKTFDWEFSGATPATGAGSSVSNIKWTATGSKTVKLTIKNVDLGCPDDITTKTVYVYDIQDDYANTIKNRAVSVDVLANDDFPNFTPSAVAIAPKHGSATINDNKISYTPANGFVGADSLRYEVAYGSHKAYAWVHLYVAEIPDNISNAECVVDPLGTDFSIQQLAISDASEVVYASGTPLVGDIDNDGLVEIVVAGGIYPNTSYTSTLLRIFEVKDNQIKQQQALATPAMIAGFAIPFCIANVDGNGYAAIFLCTSTAQNTATNQRQLIKYAYNGTSYVEERRATYSSVAEKQGGIPSVVDFNGDGRAEIVVYDKVFDAQTLTLLADGQLLSTTGMGFGRGAFSVNSDYASYMAIGDMDGDGTPEVAAGNCVYKVNITNTSGAAGNSFKLWSKCDGTDFEGNVHGEVGDGCTAIADIDGDGMLDVVVTVLGGVNTTSNNGAVYVWNPRTKKVIHKNIINTIAVPNTVQGPSAPFVGDIDNDGEPEICLTSYKKMYAYEYNKSTKELKLKWDQTTSDASSCTTMSMFDFNQDGSAELVYRDETHLRIIDGKTGKNVKDADNKDAVFNIVSGTVNEYPVVADVNNDGAAEIIVTGTSTASYTHGRLWIFSSKPVGVWGPARKVWNQFGYNAVNVNDDLTIPKYQLNPATAFPGPNGVLGNSDDVHPYNAFLQQQTTLGKNGTPIWPAPNVNFNGEPSYSYHTKGDSLLITVKFKNDGDAAIGPPVHVSVYKDAISTANFMATNSVNVMVLPGKTGECTIKIENVSSFKPYDKLVIRLNDDGSGTPVQRECNYDGNSGFKPHNQMLIAVNDVLYIPANSTGKLADVLNNDQLAGCTIDNINLDLVSTELPTRGNASISDKKVNFVPTPAYVGLDSLQYQITCGNDKATAELKIVVQALLKVEWVGNAAEPSKKGKFRISFIEAGASYSRNIKITYQITGGSAIHNTDYADVLTGTVTLPKNYNSIDFDLVTPKNNYKVEGNSRTVEVAITHVEVE